MTELPDYRLDAVRLENFMGYEDSGWVELRPITFVSGRNSSGKSALIRALLLLKQSMAAPNGDSPPLLFSGELVDLGTYYNTVREHDKSRNIAFAFRVAHPNWPDPAPLPDNPSDEQRKVFDAQLALRKSRIPSWSQGDKGADVADSPFELRLEYGLLEGNEQARLKKCSVWGYRGSELDPTPVLLFSLTYEEDGHAWLPDSEAPLDYDAQVPDYDDQGYPIMGDDEKTKYHSERRSQFSDQDWWPAAGINFYSTIVPTLILRDQVHSQSKPPGDWQIINAALDFLQKHVDNLLKSIVYQPPLRDKAQRYYRADSPLVRSLMDEESATVRQEIDRWLSAASLDARIDTRELSKEEGLVAIYLKEQPENAENDFQSNLYDVGSGVAQVLPIIAAGILAPAGSFVIIEQPELHLHPKAQAELVDFFLTMASGKKEHRFLLETHSDSILLRTRLRIAQTTRSQLPEGMHGLKHDDMILYFVERTEGVSHLTQLHFSPRGRFVEPPRQFADFFTSDLDDLDMLDSLAE